MDSLGPTIYYPEMAYQVPAPLVGVCICHRPIVKRSSPVIDRIDSLIEQPAAKRGNLDIDGLVGEREGAGGVVTVSAMDATKYLDSDSDATLCEATQRVCAALHRSSDVCRFHLPIEWSR